MITDKDKNKRRGEMRRNGTKSSSNSHPLCSALCSAWQLRQTPFLGRSTKFIALCGLAVRIFHVKVLGLETHFTPSASFLLMPTMRICR